GESRSAGRWKSILMIGWFEWGTQSGGQATPFRIPFASGAVWESNRLSEEFGPVRPVETLPAYHGYPLEERRNKRPRARAQELPCLLFPSPFPSHLVKRFL